jgi:hypothetical protein
MNIKDQLVAILGLMVIVLVAGALFFDSSEDGKVAGVESKNQAEAFSKVQEQTEHVSDIGQSVVDDSIGVEVKALDKVRKALK